MKKSILLLLTLSLFLTAASAAWAQTQAMTGPPKVIQIFIEQVKPGKGAPHEKNESGWPRAFASAKSPTHYIAMVSQTGPSEAWFITGFDSLAAWEKDTKSNEKNVALTVTTDQLSEKDGEFLSGVRSIVARYRDELSYRAAGINIWQDRYFYMTTARVRPGHGNEFIEANKIYRDAHEKANIPESWAVFQVEAGLPAGTYLTFQPLKSVAEVDAFPETHGKAYQDAIGDEGRKKLRELNSASTLSLENTIFAFNPKMSYVSKEMVGADADFWMPKPTSKPAPAATKEGEKPNAKP